MAGLAGGSNNLLRFQKCKGQKENRGFRSENVEGSQTQKAQRTCRLGPLTTTSMEALGESRFFFWGGFFANAVIVTQILQQRCGSLHFCIKMSQRRRQVYRSSRNMSAFSILLYPCKVMPSFDMCCAAKRHKLHTKLSA